MQDPDFDPYLPPRAPVGFAKPRSSKVGHIEGNPWLTMWTRPRATIRTIVDTDPSRGVLLLSVIYGISSTLSRSSQKNPGDVLSLTAILGIAVVGGSIGGILYNYISAALVRWTGSWLGGSATLDECRAAIAWGSVPSAVILIVWLGLIGVFGADLFRANGLDNADPGQGILLIGAGTIQIVMAIWAAVLIVKAVGEVHGFSAWKALGAFLLVGLIVLGFILVIVLAFAALYMGVKAPG